MLSFKRVMLSLSVGVLLAAAGCSSGGGGPGAVKYQPYDTRPTGSGQAAPAPTPEPARPAPRSEPKAEPAKPAPRASSGCGAAYRPGVGADMNVSALAFPTGDVGSSGVLIHQIVPRQVRANQPYQYEIHVTNLIDGSLQNVVVNNSSFSNLSVQASSPQGKSDGAGGVRWELGNLGPCETKVIKVTGVAGAIGASSSCLTASFANALCASTEVVQPALAISKTITPQAILNCDPITMNLEVKNTGSGVASNVHIKDTLPAGLETTDGKTAIDIAVGDLATGASKPYAIQLRAKSKGKFDNFAEATADGGLTAKSQTVSTVVTQPVLTIECKPTGDVFVGRDASFTLTVKNTGDAACDGTTVTATTNGTVTRADNNGAVNASGVTWNLGSVPAGQSKTLTLSVKTTGIGQVNVNASAQCKCAPAVQTACSSKTFGLPDIGTQVTDDDGVVGIGENHTYRVEVENQGQVNLTNVKMVVTLPEGMSFVSSADGKAVAGNKVEFNFGTLAPGSGKNAKSFVVKSSKAGELLVIGETTCTELKTPVRDDELTNFVGQ
jgi:uncharacterized repeat protein (TIGR01451 family)